MPFERIIATVAVAVFLAAATSWSGLVVLVVVDIAILTTLPVENRRIEC